MEVITDHKWKYFKYSYEVPAKVIDLEFDHLGEEEKKDYFILYRRCWYHISDFMALSSISSLPLQWQGYAPDSYSTGVLIEISNDGESYRIGTYIE